MAVSKATFCLSNTPAPPRIVKLEWPSSFASKQVSIEKEQNGRLISKEENQREDNIGYLRSISQRASRADPNGYARLLQGCADMKSPAGGKGVHAHMIKTGFEVDGFIGTYLLNMYAKCGLVEEARQVFDKMTCHNVVSWTAIIAGYAHSGHGEEALSLLSRMLGIGVSPNQFTYGSVLRACARLPSLKQGKELHIHILKTGFESDVFVASALVDMYVKCGSMENARHVFDKMQERNVVSWTAMISGYAHNGHGKEALELFSQMQAVDIDGNMFTFAGVLSACGDLQAIKQGRQMHAVIIKIGLQSNTFVGSSLVDMYQKCRSMLYARRVFDTMLGQDVVLWTAMISGYAQNGYDKEALELFIEMQWAGIEPDLFAFSSVLGACASLAALELGKQVHADIIRSGLESDLSMGTALIDMYSKCGSIVHACRVFNKISKHNVVSCTAMIAGCAHNGHGEEGLKVFCQMQRLGIKSDQFTFASVLSACTTLAALEQGKQIHAYTVKTGFESDVCVGNALVDMYAKCGSMIGARQVFDKMIQRNVVSWTGMIAGFAQHGCGKEALQVFEEMQQTGIKPNRITFICVLCACSHVGLVEEGHHYFDSMSQEHGIMPEQGHYACMVDLLGRAGKLDKAEDFINNMPFKPNAFVWRTLLGACRVHQNMELGILAAERILELEQQDSATYVLLSNIYAAAGRWDDVTRVRKLMKDKAVKKEPGQSWIEVNNRVHTFHARDKSHQQKEEIYAKLKELTEQMEALGYVPDGNIVLHCTEKEQKEQSCLHHSEMLAMAFGLISTPSEMPIRIFKNLRVCRHCHTTSKFISKIVKRELVVRDANRFHHFKDGHCSCGDYW